MSKILRAQSFNAGALSQALTLLPPKLDTLSARVLLLAIGLQESDLTARVQRVNGGGQGPARGLLQFELGGGVRGVMNHAASRELAASGGTLAGVIAALVANGILSS